MAASAAALGVVPSAAAAAAPPADLSAWTPDVRAAGAFAAGRPGVVSFHLLDETTGRRWNRLADRAVPGASLLKPLLMVAHLRRGSVRDRALTTRERAMLSPMIRRSANGPASRLAVELGADAIARAGRATGMGPVRLARPWGNTTTTARAQVALFASLPRSLPARHRSTAMTWLRSIVPSQRWGIGAIRLPGWTVALKGGWGSGTGRVDHQTALLERGGRRLVLAITTTDNGSHARGKATLRGVASRLLRGLPTDEARGPGD